jgi:hypothetical protein
MSKERIIQVLSWLILGTLLLYLVPKDKVRDANVVFLFNQVLTWICGLIVAEKNLIEYPVRLFKNANKSSFTFGYFTYPSICVLFNLFYPYHENIQEQILYYAIYSTGVTIIEVLLENYTQLIKYIRWKWYLTWITLCLTLFISNFYYRWFFQVK